MAANRLSRAFSRREKIMVLILAVIAVIAFYYFAVVQTVASTTAANDAALADIEDQIAVQNVISEKYAKMEAELEGLGSLDQLPEVASYDNLSNELQELNGVLAAATSYDLSFTAPEVEGETIRRVVNVSFTTPNYGSALSIVEALQNGKYRCEIRDISLTSKILANGSIDSVTGTLKVTYYETTVGANNLNGLNEKKS